MLNGCRPHRLGTPRQRKLLSEAQVELWRHLDVGIREAKPQSAKFSLTLALYILHPLFRPSFRHAPEERELLTPRIPVTATQHGIDIVKASKLPQGTFQPSTGFLCFWVRTWRLSANRSFQSRLQPLKNPNEKKLRLAGLREGISSIPHWLWKALASASHLGSQLLLGFIWFGVLKPRRATGKNPSRSRCQAKQSL